MSKDVGTVTARLAMTVAPKVAVGKTTVAGSAVSLIAYVLAIVAYLGGARDEATISALVVGTVALVSTLAGRYGQAIALVLKGLQQSTIAAGASSAPATELVSQPRAFSGTRSKVELSASPEPTLSVTNTAAPATAPVAGVPEPEAPFTADGERVTVGDFETYPLESFVADPKDRHGANDTPAEVTP